MEKYLPEGNCLISTLIPPGVTGYQKFDLYPTPNNSGDATKAKEYLKKCGKPSGFTIGLGVRSDRPNDVAAGTAIQAALAKVGIKTEIQKYPSGKWASDYAGVPAFVHSHNMGLFVMKWGADWPTGYGFLDQIVDGKALKASGNFNMGELNDPNINKLIADGIKNNDTAAREKAWGEVDKAVMEQAVYVPLIYNKVLQFRPPKATNVITTSAYSGMYDWLFIGTK